MITALQISVFLVTVITLSNRIEHRLTKIETDVSWLKNNNKSLCKNTKKGK